MSDNENVDPYNDDRWSIFKDDYLPFTNDPDIEYQELLRYIRQPIIHTSVSDSEDPTVDSHPPVYQPQVFEIMEKLANCRKCGGYPHENASILLHEFQSFAALHKIDPLDDSRMIAAFHLNLTGPALTWFNTLGSTYTVAWQGVLQIFKEKYIDLDWQHPAIFLESETFHNMKLSKGQVLGDFYRQIIEKGQILKKQDHEILSQFI